MFAPARTRLVLWYVGVLTGLLALSGVVMYLFLTHTMQGQVDNYLDEISGAIQSTLRAEHRGVRPDSESVSAIIADFQYRDMDITVADARSGQVLGVTIGGADPAVPRRVVVHRFAVTGRPLVLTLKQSLRVQTAVLRELRNAYIIALPLIMILGYLGGVALADRSLAPAVQAFERQRQFMADASHELRTPIALVAGESELALSRTDRAPEEYRESLRTIHGESRRMARIVDELFLLARIDAGEPVVLRTELYVNEIVAECVRALRSLAQARGVHVTLAAESSIDVPMRGDEVLLRRMIMNLLDNAVKYTSEGGTVTVGVHAENGICRITVGDTGVGIPSDLHERVFERFFRGEHSQVSGSVGGGAGLGLPIARSIAEAHGGSLHIERSDGQGTLIRASFPMVTTELS